MLALSVLEKDQTNTSAKGGRQISEQWGARWNSAAPT